jgi:hypothetical protein
MTGRFLGLLPGPFSALSTALCMLRAGLRAVSPVTAGRRVSGWRAGGAPATMAASPAEALVIDLTSPATEAPPHRSGGRSRRRGSSGVSVIDLTLTSPRSTVPGPLADLSPAHGAASGGEVHATTLEVGREPSSPRPDAGAAAGAPPAALGDGAARPPRFLFASGKASDLRKRGLLPVGEKGQPLCRWCKGEVQPPKVRQAARVGKNTHRLVSSTAECLLTLLLPCAQRTFCSPSCVHEHMVRTNPTYSREVRKARAPSVHFRPASPQG